MKAISLHQPYASFVALGHKTYETRTWKPPDNLIGRPLAIHAAKKWTVNQRQFASFAIAHISGIPQCAEAINLFKTPPLGAIVCACRIVEVYRVEDVRGDLSPLERLLGDYANGRFAWKLELVHRFQYPILTKGQQGLFNWNS